MLGGVKKCAKCEKMVYPIEELKCLDKIWHKNCFKCTVCSSLLNMKNYKGFEKQPYCSVHYPQQKPTSVNDNPELARIKENTKFQSNVKYHEDFEKSKGFYTTVADDPETKRILENSRNISQAKYHEDFEKNVKSKCTSLADSPETTRAIENQKLVSSAEYKGIKNQQNVQHLTTPSRNECMPPLNLNNVMLLQNAPTATHQFIMPKNRMNKQVINASGHQQQRGGIGSITDYDPDNFNDMRIQRPIYQQPLPKIASFDLATSNMVAMNYANFSNQFSHNHKYYTDTTRSDLNSDELTSTTRVPPLPDGGGEIKTSVYKAIYDYDGNEEDELSFRDGDKFINCELIDVGWMIGVHEKTGKHGMFPSNYAEPIDFF